jgi:acetylglutamate kinase
MKDKVYIVKIGGHVIDDDAALCNFLKTFSEIKGHKILVHGGGKLATQLAERLEIPQNIINGRRITDKDTLEIAIMVYAGLINKKIVSYLQSFEANAIGLSGADGNLIHATKRKQTEIDYGFVGDVEPEGINTNFIKHLFSTGIIPVISPITYSKESGLLNTNADTIASSIALALSDFYDIHLIYCFEKNGVLRSVENDDSVISHLNKKEYLDLKEAEIIANGMIPKLENIFMALENGVKQVNLCHAGVNSLQENDNGTRFTIN